MYYILKRTCDIIISLILLILLLPLLLIIGLVIVLDSKGGAIFKQNRMGRNGKPYNMYKFRTMVVGAQDMGTGVYSFEGDPRITKVGNFLRKTSLDELPQLINILKGDMSLVGPRSPVIGHFPDYESLDEAYRRRFSVMPGITGLAQVVGRNEFTWDEKVKYDNIYIDKIAKYGLLYDAKILFMTFGRVFSMSDVSEKRENMEKNKQSLEAQTGASDTEDK